MNKALLVIDFINDIAHPDGRIAASAAQVIEQDAIAHANQALAHARAHGWLVVLIKVGFDEGYLLQPRVPHVWPCPAVRGPLPGGQRHRLSPGSRCTTRGSGADQTQGQPFYGTALEPALRANRIEHLYVCGVSTSWAIQGRCEMATIGTTPSPSWKMPARRRMPQNTRLPCACSVALPDHQGRGAALTTRI